MIFAAKSLQSCPTLCSPVDGSPLGSSVPGILQARILAYQEGTGKSGSYGMWNHPRGHVWNVFVRPASS